jgi:hypothetical protein
MILQMLGEEALTSRGDYLQCSVKINLFRGKGRGGKHFGKWEAPLQSLTNGSGASLSLTNPHSVNVS